jgi:hypothetical protein
VVVVLSGSTCMALIWLCSSSGSSLSSATCMGLWPCMHAVFTCCYDLIMVVL